MNAILITGCNRGLGLGLIRSFLRLPNPPRNIFATVRDASKAPELQELAKAHHEVNLRILELEVTDCNSFPRLASQVAEASTTGLDLLVNNAGYAPKSTRLNFVQPETMAETFRINVIAPLILAKELMPLLSKSSSAASPSWVVNMSSVLGSMTQNESGGLYPYRCSKSALNSCTKSLSIDAFQKHVHAICLHPGWVRTDMGGKNAQLEVDDACHHMVQLLTNLTADKNGKFLQYDGQELPW